MSGKNWYSKEKVWKDLVGEDTKTQAARAKDLIASGNSKKAVAKILGCSQSRVYELLKP